MAPPVQRALMRPSVRSKGGTLKTIGLALVLTIAACGQEAETRAPPEVSQPWLAAESEPSGTTPSETTAIEADPVETDKAQTATLRLRGVGWTGAVWVQVASVEMTIDGQVVDSPLQNDSFDVGDDQSAWRVADFVLPDDARNVGIKLTFTPTGTVEREGEVRPLDMRGPPLSFVASAAQIRTQRKVVLDVDLARSLVEQDGQVFFFPDVLVRY